MVLRRHAANIVFAVVCALCLCGNAGADTIILKNGRRIVATNATIHDGKVSFETSAGSMSLPESLVLRIEHDGANPVSNNSLRDKVADLAIAPPPADSATEIGRAHV
jgi:hypothetical protein